MKGARTTVTYKLQKSTLNWSEDLNAWPKTVKLQEENTEKNIYTGQRFFYIYNSKITENKAKNNMELWYTKKLLQNTGNNQHDEETTYKIEENICQTCIVQEVSNQNICLQRRHTNVWGPKLNHDENAN